MTHARVSHRTVAEISSTSVRQDCATRLYHKHVPEACKSVPQECPPKSVSQECQGGVSSVKPECPTRVSEKTVKQECLKLSQKSAKKGVPKKCTTKASRKRVQQKSPNCKNVPQECPTKVSRTSVKQECDTRESQKSVK